MSKDVTVAVAAEFMESFSKLPKMAQGKTMDFFNRFSNNPAATGINYEKIHGCADKKIFSVRIDDTYRGIVVRQEKTGVYILLWVDHHDKAYDWAIKKRCEINTHTGAVQLFETQTVAEQPAKVKQDGIFSYLADDVLLKIGVPELQIPLVKSFGKATDFFAAKDKLPDDTFEYLHHILVGEPVEDVLELVEAEKAESGSAEDLAAALEAPAAQRSFVVVDGEEELRWVMDKPLEKWRVFLHPTQRKIVDSKYSGAARVLGGAGTGKTVVAMHRAKRLAAGLSGRGKILFTTFTANLAQDIKDNLRKICTADEQKKIEIINLDSWVSQYLREAGFSARVIYGDELKQLWSDAVLQADASDDFPESFFEDEWNRVAIAQEAVTLEKYVKAVRAGRGTRLDRKKRIAVWQVFDVYQNLMKERQVRDINTAMYECTQLLAKAGNRKSYDHIIVDEGQDFSNNAFRLLRALAGEAHMNDLFIVGDAHQRIYKNKPVLSRCGINVRGRSSILKINYRTTEEIRLYAFALLNGIAFDDLDEETDLGDKCESLTHGDAPLVKLFKTANAEFDFILNEVKQLQEKGVALSDICITARTHKLIADYESKFKAAGIATYIIDNRKTDNRSYDGLRLATMHRVKGLEFEYMFVAAVNYKVLPLPAALIAADDVAKEEALTSEKCLLYVALTRAQKGAYITAYGKKSKLLG